MNSLTSYFAYLDVSYPYLVNNTISSPFLYGSCMRLILLLAAALQAVNGFDRSVFREGRLPPVRRLRMDTPVSAPDVWRVRRKIIRGVLTPILKESKKPKERQEGSESDSLAKNAVLFTAFFVAVSATIVRIGGRAALVNVLGLDFVTDSGVKEQVDGFLTSFQSLGEFRYLAFLGAWVLAKSLLLDPITIVLALSSGVLFGGVWEGVAASVVCSSTASLVGFYLARTVLRERALEEISKRPALKAIDRACSKEGFKTVFTLRVSPLIPIPIGAYNYVYGTTSVSPIDFLLGISLGSIKPYFLDSYLGIFGKSIIDNDSSQNDWVLVAVLGIVILVGTLAADVASRTWDEIQREVDESNDPSVNEQSSDLQRMLGVKDSDLPDFMLKAKRALEAAWTRVGGVVQDEWRSINEEDRIGIDISEVVSWDGNIRQEKIKKTSEMDYWYTGVRRISTFEQTKPDSQNLSDYTLESLVFSFALIFYVFRYLSDPKIS